MLLSDVSDDVSFPKGTVFRFPPNDSYYGEKLDIMLFIGDALMGVVTITGYKAGHVIGYLPAEAFADGTYIVSGKWLRENWREWVWPETAPDLVEIVGKLGHP